MSSPFNPDRSLLNPKFEGYKLDPLEQAQCARSYPLLGEGATQSTVSSQLGSQPSFKEVQSRISFNHLFAGFKSNEVAYVDKMGNVILVNFDFTAYEPRMTIIFEIPKIISSGSDPRPREYPSLTPLNPDLWLVSDGAGRLYMVRVIHAENERTLGVPITTYEVTEERLHLGLSSSLVPFRLHHARMVLNGTEAELEIMISVKKVIYHPLDPLSAGKGANSNRKIQFQLSILDLPALNSESHNADSFASPPVLPTLRWMAVSDDIPVHARLSPAKTEYLILASSAYVPISASGQPSIFASTEPRDPLPEEIAPIPRIGEILDTVPAEASPPKTPLYSWAQTGDSLTVAFFLPASTTKSHIRVALDAKHFSLHIIDPPNIELSPDGIVLPHLRIPKFERREWWDGVDRGASVWTWEKEGEKVGGRDHIVGVLTLYLEKLHEDTKWPHLFSQTQSLKQEEKEQYEDVPETLDPMELLAAREALEKYTAALVLGEDASGLGLGRGVPSLARREIDDEVDTDVGRRVVCSWLSVTDGQRVDIASGTRVGDGWPLDLLALPLPVSTSLPDSGVPHSWSNSVVGKLDIDGLLYTLSPSQTSALSTWTHTSTFPALAFVLASKRDTRFALHAGATAVLAFESGSSGSGSGNVYVYRGAPGKSKWGKQAVLKVAGGSAGALLGVTALLNPSSMPSAERAPEGIVILALCEKELIVLRDVV